MLERKQEDGREETALEEFKLLRASLSAGEQCGVGGHLHSMMRTPAVVCEKMEWGHESEQVEPTQMRARVRWWHQRQKHCDVM